MADVTASVTRERVHLEVDVISSTHPRERETARADVAIGSAREHVITATDANSNTKDRGKSREKHGAQGEAKAGDGAVPMEQEPQMCGQP